MRLTDEKIAELWHEANGQPYKFARLVEVYVDKQAEPQKEFYGYVVWPRMGGTPWFQMTEPQGYVEFDIVYRYSK